MIHIKNLSLTFHEQTIFDTINVSIDQHARIGLVGRNGSGKSTLLKIIAGIQEPDRGSVSLLPGKRIAYMPQDVVLTSKRSILDETVAACTDIASLKHEMAALEKQLEHNGCEATIERYLSIQEQLTQCEPEALQAQAEKILQGLGFCKQTVNQSVETLSVGWKMRIVLAQLLLQKADFYLFDEPTNHLDIVAKDWFLDFLKNASCGFLLVCHERYFLDQLCSNILALELGKAKLYKGNYEHFEQQYAHDSAQLEAAYIQQQKELKRKAETIARFKAKANKAKMTKSMQKKIDTIERIELPPKPKDVVIQFPEALRAPRIILTVSNVAHTFGDRPLFCNISFVIERNERVALVAANGVGKTTLFRLISKEIPLQKGSITFGDSVQYARFAQDQNELLHGNQTIFDNMKHLCHASSEQQIRSFLGAFLFSGDDILKKVSILSGGEKNRVALASVLMQKANVLLLDEPTNHLDIQSKEVLIQALKSFTGTILFVSHDHYFINQLATRVIELTPHGALSYHGNYKDYLAQKKPEKTEAIQEKKQQKSNNKHQQKQKKELRSLEHRIARLEQEIKAIEQSFAELTFASNAFLQAEQTLKKKQDELYTYMEMWEAAFALES